MKTIIIIFVIVIVLLFISQIILLSQIIKLKEAKHIINNNLENKIENFPLLQKYKLNWKIYTLITLSILIITFSFFAPLVFTGTTIKEFDFTATGQIGDTIGGLMNPFVSMAGVIITGLAFYIQYKANQQQRELFTLEQIENKQQLQSQIDNQTLQNKLQQIESQFYEMLRLHRENVSEMKIHGYDFEEGPMFKKFEKNTEGRKVFVTMKTELEFIIKLYKKDHVLDKMGFQKCYKIFFSGLEEFEKKHPEDKNFSDLLRLARAQHMYPKDGITKNAERKEFLIGLELNFNYKPFSGHSSRLGHYFRHLYLAVKSIANNDLISEYDDKMRFLRLLRAQLSNHEQILLFYNWLSDYGEDWEKDDQQFFTEYCMIRNLWWDSLIIDDFIRNKVNELRTKKVKFRKDKMFEID